MPYPYNYLALTLLVLFISYTLYRFYYNRATLLRFLIVLMGYLLLSFGITYITGNLIGAPNSLIQGYAIVLCFSCTPLFFTLWLTFARVTFKDRHISRRKRLELVNNLLPNQLDIYLVSAIFVSGFQIILIWSGQLALLAADS